MFKTKIEVVTGFLGSGKTTFIKSFLEETSVGNEKTLILQYEEGEEKLEANLDLKGEIIYLPLQTGAPTLFFLKHLLNLYEPDRLVIEWNGTTQLDALRQLLATEDLRRLAYLSTVFNILDGASFLMYWKNLSPLIAPCLRESHMMMVTKCHVLAQANKVKIKKILEEENSEGHILFAKDRRHMKNLLNTCTLLDKGMPKAMRLGLMRPLKSIVKRNVG